MDRTTRIRRVGLLCCYFARNYAYYKAGWDAAELKVNHPFWIALNSNFIDMSVLDWCKLFGDYKDKHHWKNILSSSFLFKEKMFKALNIKQVDLDKVHGVIKTYRDKFIAHLDSDEVMKIPELDLAFKMVCFYYLEVRRECKIVYDWPSDLDAFYEHHFEIALLEYNSK